MYLLLFDNNFMQIRQKTFEINTKPQNKGAYACLHVIPSFCLRSNIVILITTLLIIILVGTCTCRLVLLQSTFDGNLIVYFMSVFVKIKCEVNSDTILKYVSLNTLHVQ